MGSVSREMWMIMNKCVTTTQVKVLGTYFFLKFMSPMASVFTFHLGDIVTLKPLYFDPWSTLLKLESVSAHLGMYYFSL